MAGDKYAFTLCWKSQTIHIKVFFLLHFYLLFIYPIDWSFETNVFYPNLNNSNTKRPINNVSLEILCSVCGIFRYKKARINSLDIIVDF